MSRRRSGRAVLGARGGGAGHAAQRPTAWSSRAEPAPLPSHPSPWGPRRLALSPESWWLFPQHLLPPFPPLPLPSPQAAPQQQSRTPSSASLHVSRVHPASSSLAHPKDPLLSPALTWPTLTWPHPHLAHPFWPALPGQLLHKPAAASIPAPCPAGSRAPLYPAVPSFPPLRHGEQLASSGAGAVPSLSAPGEPGRGAPPSPAPPPSTPGPTRALAPGQLWLLPREHAPHGSTSARRAARTGSRLVPAPFPSPPGLAGWPRR